MFTLRHFARRCSASTAGSTVIVLWAPRHAPHACTTLAWGILIATHVPFLTRVLSMQTPHVGHSFMHAPHCLLASSSSHRRAPPGVHHTALQHMSLLRHCGSALQQAATLPPYAHHCMYISAAACPTWRAGSPVLRWLRLLHRRSGL